MVSTCNKPQKLQIQAKNFDALQRHESTDVFLHGYMYIVLMPIGHQLSRLIMLDTSN